MSTATKTFLAHQSIFKEGDGAEQAYVVVRGSVEIYVHRAGKVIQLDVIRQGQCFGEMGALTGQARSTAARCLEYCELLVLEKEQLASFLNQGQPVARTILQALIARIRKLDSKALANFEDRYTLTSLSRLLVLLARPALAAAAAPAPVQPGVRAAGDSSAGAAADVTRLPETATVETIAQLLNTGEPGIRNALKRMEGLNLVSFEASSSGRAVKFRARELVENAERLERSLSQLMPAGPVAEVRLEEMPAVAKGIGMEIGTLLAAFSDGRLPAEWLLLRSDRKAELLQRTLDIQRASLNPVDGPLQPPKPT
ncbi:MAG: cyclic nucleotide-binding domain-containing protein [Deltaproteobacteria bacterium]|nr:cyclic nucleotide-binding domain-containing protein [Deltaproteobacteria bacterium]